jgi:cytochrome c553
MVLARSTLAAIFVLALASTGFAETPEAPPGAMSCSGCHPATRGIDTPVPRLIGRNAADIVVAMQAFRSGTRQGTVMDRIAKGFTVNEIKAIANWYAGQHD